MCKKLLIAAFLALCTSAASAQEVVDSVRVNNGDGTAAAPAYTFTSEPTLGFFRNSSTFIGVTGNMIPKTTQTYDFGAQGFRWRYSYAQKQFIGDDSTVANNGLFRHLAAFDGVSQIAVMKGDETGFGDFRVNRLSGGSLLGGGDYQFICSGFGTCSGTGNFWNLNTAQYNGPDNAVGMSGLQINVNTGSTLPVYTGRIAGANIQYNGNGGTNNLTNIVYGTYSGSFPDTTATATEADGAAGEAGSGTGTITHAWGITGEVGGWNVGVMTVGAAVHAEQSYSYDTSIITTNAGVLIEDMAINASDGVSALPTSAANNYMIKGRTTSAAHDLNVMATGLVGAYGATPTATAPFFLNGTAANVEQNNGNTSTAQTIDWSKGNIQRSTLTGNVTFTFTNPAAGGQTEYTLLLFTGAGSFTATWPAAVKWPGATPTITATANRMDKIRFTWDATAAEYFAEIVQTWTP